jgi:hypothetical protein
LISPVAVPEAIVIEPAAGTVVPVNVFECFAPSSVNFQPVRLTEVEPVFVVEVQPAIRIPLTIVLLKSEEIS